MNEADKRITKSVCGDVITHFPIGLSMTELPKSEAYNLTEKDFTPWQGYGEY
jgi:hypothetical protein